MEHFSVLVERPTPFENRAFALPVITQPGAQHAAGSENVRASQSWCKSIESGPSVAPSCSTAGQRLDVVASGH
jgi:hypothetical protein